VERKRRRESPREILNVMPSPYGPMQACNAGLARPRKK
jgi:hypothetical protein